MGRCPKPRGMRRIPARTHSLFLHLASLRASAQGPKPTPLLYLSAHARFPSRSTLLTQCLVDPIIGR
jgi:hypothetical protein